MSDLIRTSCFIVLGALTLVLGPSGLRAAEVDAQHVTLLCPTDAASNAGKPDNFTIEIAAEALHRAGYIADRLSVSWPQALTMAQAGSGILPSLPYTEEREKIFFFSLTLRRGTERDYIGIAKTRRDAVEIVGRIEPALASIRKDGTIDRIVAANRRTTEISLDH